MVSDWETTNIYKDLPPPVWQFIKDKGFLGMIIPKEYGGLGFSAFAHSQVVAKLASRCSAVVVTVMVSYMTKPKPDVELSGLVYGVTAIPREDKVPFYQRPLFWAAVVGVVFVILNIIFW